ncbi:MAG: radical SAM protein [Desulfobacterales bacterium]|nr:radical SAM protein [Desulfobacterales bacterium]
MGDKVVYGPVPSRRLGRSLGVDLVPYKICSYDCIYCQIGRTPAPTIERKPYIPADKVIHDVQEALEEGVTPDYITLGGSGEPTLNSDIGEIITRLKSATEIPVTVLTNGSMLMFPAVMADLMAADVVLPSFDACTPEMFQKINRPCPEIGFEEMAEGLVHFREAYTGQIWVEIFLIQGMNTADADIQAFKYSMDRVQPDKIHLNTAVRPTAEAGISRPSDARLIQIKQMLGDRAEIVVPYQGEAAGAAGSALKEDLIQLLSRRPCTLKDIAHGLNTHPHEILKYLEPMVSAGAIEMVRKDEETYYQRRH